MVSDTTVRPHSHSPARPLLRGSAVLAAALLAATAAPRPAHAQLVGCRGDPVVVLSDGTELDLSATINDSSQDVQQVTFTLQVPQGTAVVAYTPGALGPKEVLQVVADGSPATYQTTTLVDTYTGGIQVTATTQAGGARAKTTPRMRVGAGAAMASTAGQDDQALTVRVTL